MRGTYKKASQQVMTDTGRPGAGEGGWVLVLMNWKEGGWVLVEAKERKEQVGAADGKQRVGCWAERANTANTPREEGVTGRRRRKHNMRVYRHAEAGGCCMGCTWVLGKRLEQHGRLASASGGGALEAVGCRQLVGERGIAGQSTGALTT